MPRCRTEVGTGGLVYVGVTTLLAAATAYLQANLLFWATGLLIAGLAVSLALAWVSLRGVTVKRFEPLPGVVGEKLVLRYQLHNAKRWLPVFNIVICETWGRDRWWRAGWKRRGPVSERPQRLGGRPHGWLMHLGPGQTALAEAPCWPGRRGVLGFERIVLSTSFPFGLVRRTVQFPQEGRALIFPRLYRIERTLWRRLCAADPAGHLHVERAGMGDEFFGLRPYRVGDRLRVVDWKHSAHTGQLISREMTQPSPPRLMLVLDLTELPVARGGEALAPHAAGAGAVRGAAAGLWQRFWQRGPNPNKDGGRPRIDARPTNIKSPGELAGLPAEPLERAVSLTASIVCAAHAQGYQVGLAVCGAACPPFRVYHSLPHRTRMLEALALLDAAQPGGAAASAGSEATVIIRASPLSPIRGRERMSRSIGTGEGVFTAPLAGAATSPPAVERFGPGGRTVVLPTTEMSRYVIEAAGGASELLLRNSPAARRHAARRAPAWT